MCSFCMLETERKVNRISRKWQRGRNSAISTTKRKKITKLVSKTPSGNRNYSCRKVDREIWPNLKRSRWGGSSFWLNRFPSLITRFVGLRSRNKIWRLTIGSWRHSMIIISRRICFWRRRRISFRRSWISLKRCMKRTRQNTTPLSNTWNLEIMNSGKRGKNNINHLIKEMSGLSKSQGKC